MGNRYFSCLKTPFGCLYYHSCCCCWVPFCGLSTRHGPSRPMSVLLSVLRCQPSAIRRLLSAVCCLPSAVCGYLRLPALRYPTVLRSFVKLSVTLGLKFASRNSGCSSWEEKKITNHRRYFYMSYSRHITEISREIVSAL